MTATLGACGASVDVRTAVAPEASTLAGRRTFRVVESGSKSETGGKTHNGNGNGNGHAEASEIVAADYGIRDPMVENSITSGVVFDHIRAAFEAKGDRYAPEHADFDIVYKATVAPVLDVRSYNYAGFGGYWGPYWYNGYYPGYCCGFDSYGHAVGSYDRGTVIIDAIDPGSKKLLWRGQGTSDSYESGRFMKSLTKSVKAIAKKFPAAQPQPTVALVP